MSAREHETWAPTALDLDTEFGGDAVDCWPVRHANQGLERANGRERTSAMCKLACSLGRNRSERSPAAAGSAAARAAECLPHRLAQRPAESRIGPRTTWARCPEPVGSGDTGTVERFFNKVRHGDACVSAAPPVAGGSLIADHAASRPRARQSQVKEERCQLIRRFPRSRLGTRIRALDEIGRRLRAP